MTNITIDTREEVRSGELGLKLRHYNYGGRRVPRAAVHPPQREDENGRLLGGLRSFVFLYWLNVEVLFVEEDARGAGLGGRLLVEAEGKPSHWAPRTRNSAFEWQARAARRSTATRKFARIDDYAPGFYLAYMKKSLLGP